MEENLFKLASSQGIWSFLSIFLIFYILKQQQIRDEKQDEREYNYQKIINDLTTRLNIIKNLEKDIKTLIKK